MINARIPSSPTNFDGRRRLTALGKSESKTDTVGRESDNGKSVEKSPMLQLLKTILSVQQNPLKLHVAGPDGFYQSQVEWNVYRFS